MLMQKYEMILTDIIQQIAVLKENRTTQSKPKIQQSAQQEIKSVPFVTYIKPFFICLFFLQWAQAVS